MREYVEEAQLGVVIGGTLFIHGGVTEASMGFVPTDNQDGPQVAMHPTPYATCHTPHAMPLLRCPPPSTHEP